MTNESLQFALAIVRWIGILGLTGIVCITIYGIVSDCVAMRNGYEPRSLPGCTGVYWAKRRKE